MLSNRQVGAVKKFLAEGLGEGAFISEIFVAENTGKIFGNW